MAERLFVLALRDRLGDDPSELYVSHGAGTGSWHVGEAMNPPAARQLTARGADPSGFAARTLSAKLIDESDLVLCATGGQVERVLELRPDAAGKTFVLGEFGRLLAEVDLSALPSPGSERGLALVAAVDALRLYPGGRRASLPVDDLGDPWGGPDDEFARAADQIEATVIPLATALTGR